MALSIAALLLVGAALFVLNSHTRQDAGLQLSFEPARPMEKVALAEGSVFTLQAERVFKEIGGRNYSLYAYNKQLPGPVIQVEQGSKITVNFKNNLPEPTTVHWHGLRLKNEFDGVPDVTQKPVEPGGSFRYELEFPDEGIYWYHPHVREDRQQELGLYGAILVKPRNATYFNPVDREEILFLDDLLLDEKGDYYAFEGKETNFAVMGRYGNLMLLNGRPDYSLKASKGETIRFFLINSANVRPFRVQFEGAKMKLVGADSGKYERESIVDSVTLAPSERAIVEVLFENSGRHMILNNNPSGKTVLGEVAVEDSKAGKSRRIDFASEKPNPEITASMEEFRKYFNAPPDFIYNLSVEVEGATPIAGLFDDEGDGIEWQDAMFAGNKVSTSERVKWTITDKGTGAKNMDIKHSVKKGKVFKIRLENNDTSLHPMQHPMHLHGARFLALNEGGKENKNLVWKDTVLVPARSSVELLTYFPNEGEWMLHCHIAEHLGSGMMSSIKAV